MSKIDVLSQLRGMEAQQYLDCLKISAEVVVWFRTVGHRTYTSISFVTDDGTTDDCSFKIKGNPFAFNPNQSERFPVVPGGSPALLGDGRPMADGDPITGFTFGELDQAGDLQPVWRASGLPGVTAAEFISILTDSTGSYARFIALFDDATRVTGGDADDEIEVGAGNDVVDAEGGNDTVHKWLTGDLTCRGGAGIDTLSFAAFTGNLFPTTPAQQLVVDLRSGTATNPYGGTITLDGVENIVGTPWADILNGDDGANVIGNGRFETAGDVINARGGDDTVNFFSFAGFFPALEGAVVDGGKGIDTLVFQYDFGGNVLDLGDPSLNAGMLRDSTFRSIERWVVGPDFSTSFGALTFRGDEGANHLEVRQGVLDIDMGGGDDTLVLLAKTTSDPVAADGSAGTDRLVFNGPGPAFVLDLGNSANNTGPFAGGTFTGFEIFEVGPDDPLALPPPPTFDFRGDGKDSTAIGGRGGDSLSGKGGRDMLDGGDGSDTLTGGGGADEFRFASLDVADVLTDFRPGTDRIVLSATVFAALGPTVTAAELRLFHAALDGNDRLLYDVATGLLSYDADADGAGAAVVFADIGAGQAPTSADFVIA